MHGRDAAKRKAITSHDPCDWHKYKQLQNKINNNIKTSKASFQSRGNPQKTWQTLNELTSGRVNNATVKELKLNNAVISSLVSFLILLQQLGPDLLMKYPQLLSIIQVILVI